MRCLFLVLSLCAAAALPAQKKVAVADLKSDLEFLRKALVEAHPGIDRYNMADSVSMMTRVLSERLQGDSVPIQQAHVMIRLIVSMVHDGHTSVETPFFDENTMVLPFSTHVSGAKAYLMGNYSADSTIEKGSEILSVNDCSAYSIIQIGLILHSGDGYNTSFQQAVGSAYFARHAALLQCIKPVNHVVLRTPEGRKKEYDIAAMSRAELIGRIEKAALKNVNKKTVKPVLHNKSMLLYRDTAVHDLAILQLGSFPNKHYKRFYRKMFRWLEKEQIGHLAVDVRFNTGGNVHNMGDLAAHILDQPLRYTYWKRRHTHAGRFFNFKNKMTAMLVWLRYATDPRMPAHRREGYVTHTWKVKPARRHNYDGKVYVLTNGWSFSAASMCASFLKNNGHATVIGKETGGSESGNCGGGYPYLMLPHTHFKVRFPLRLLLYDIGQPDKGRGVIPDYPITYTPDDLLKGKDLELEKLRALIAH